MWKCLHDIEWSVASLSFRLAYPIFGIFQQLSYPYCIYCTRRIFATLFRVPILEITIRQKSSIGGYTKDFLVTQYLLTKQQCWKVDITVLADREWNGEFRWCSTNTVADTRIKSSFKPSIRERFKISLCLYVWKDDFYICE